MQAGSCWTSGRKRPTTDPRDLGCRCDECPLNGKATPVFPTKARHDKPRLIIVGEGPGRKEEAQGKPFVGVSGALLNQVLAEAGIDRAECHVTNAALCAGDWDKDNEHAAKACAPRLLREAALYPDTPILTLGVAAARTILGVSSVQLARGFVWTAPEVSDAKLKAAKKNEARTVELGLKRQLAGRKVFPTVHPAFVLRSDAWRPIFQIDVNRVGRWLRGELDDSRVDNNIEGRWSTVDDPGDLRRTLDRFGPVVSCDIETTITGSVLTADIVCVGISDGKTTVVIDPWVPAAHAAIVSDAFRSRTVVGHNFLNFDKLALERDGVVFEGPVEDTLLAHHAFASHFPQKLDQVVSTFCDATPWKIVFGRRGGTVASEKGGLPPHKMPAAERDFYCAQDCVLTWLAWERMQKDLAPERHVYEHDKRLSALCSGMQVGGIGVDHEKREELLGALEGRAAGLLFKMREGLGWPEFDPARVAHVKDALYNRLKARVIERTPTGQPSTSEAVLERFAGDDEVIGSFARDLMTYRLVVKVHSTYVAPIPILADGRAHYNWKGFGTVSGRMASRFQSVPRPGPLPEQHVRSLYCATGKLSTARLVAQVHDAASFEVGDELVYFDLSQAEARLAAYLSGDPELIAAVETDIHTANARLLFGTKPGAEDGRFDNPKLKGLLWEEGGYRRERDVTKNAGFCVWYVGAADKVYTTLTSKGFPVTLRHCEIFYNRCHDKYWRYYEYVNRNLAQVRKDGYMRTAQLGRFRWLGYFSAITDVANYPIQAGIADCMNERLMEIEAQAKFMASAADVAGLIKEVWSRPVVLRRGPIVSEDREFVLPAEIKRGKRWSEL